MFLRRIGTLIVASVMTSTANAQLLDDEQRSAWLFLQELSVEAESLSACIVRREFNAMKGQFDQAWDSKPAWEKYRGLTDELARGVESFVRKYHARMTDHGSEYSLTQFVWRVVIRAGEGAGMALTDVQCQLILRK